MLTTHIGDCAEGIGESSSAVPSICIIGVGNDRAIGQSHLAEALQCISDEGDGSNYHAAVAGGDAIPSDGQDVAIQIGYG